MDDPYYMTGEEERKAIIANADEQMREVMTLLDDLPGEARQEVLQHIVDLYCFGCARQHIHCTCARCADCGAFEDSCTCDEREQRARNKGSECDNELPF